MMSSIPEIDRFSYSKEGCQVKRKLKTPDGKFYTVDVYRPEIFSIFEKNMGGVDTL